MSHDIDHSTGKPAMAYVGETPWHQLGEKLPPGQDIETWIKAARLDWNIQMLPVTYQFEGRNLLMPKRFVLARSDNGSPLSIVSGNYLVVQPKEVLEFYRDLMATRHYTLETAGALDGGRKVWALARTGMVANVAGDAADELGAYVLLATSCDKSLATTAAFTSVRVVCQNTLRFAMNDIQLESRRSIRVDHTRIFDAQGIQEQLGLIDESWVKFLEKINPMAKHKVTPETATAFFKRLLQTDTEWREGKSLSIQKAREQNQLMSAFTSAAGQQTVSAKGTLWGLVNAVSYYVDHVRPTTSGDRLDSAWFGSGNVMKEKAWGLAIQYVHNE